MEKDESFLSSDESGPPWYMILLYAALALGMVAAIFFPFVRRVRRKVT